MSNVTEVNLRKSDLEDKQLNSIGLTSNEIEYPFFGTEDFPFKVKREDKNKFSLHLWGEYNINIGAVNYTTLNILLFLFREEVDKSEADYE